MCAYLEERCAVKAVHIGTNLCDLWMVMLESDAALLRHIWTCVVASNPLAKLIALHALCSPYCATRCTRTHLLNSLLCPCYGDSVNACNFHSHGCFFLRRLLQCRDCLLLCMLLLQTETFIFFDSLLMFDSSLS